MIEGPDEPNLAQAPVPEGARCAEHPERVAKHTCVRCGNYVCVTCLAGPYQRVCRTCNERSGTPLDFPFDRESFTAEGLLNLALSVWKRHLLALTLATIALLVVTAAPNLLFEYLITGSLPTPGRPPIAFLDLSWGGKMLRAVQQVTAALIGAATYLMYAGYLLDLLQGKPVSLAAVSKRLRALGAYIVMYVVAFAAASALFLGAGLIGLVATRVHGTALTLVLLAVAAVGIPALVYAALGLAFGGFELAVDPDTGPWAATRSAWLLVAGKRWRTLNVCILSAFIALLGLVACFVGFFATFPLALLFFGGLFLALKRSPGLGYSKQNAT
jgi:hypothetical protein